MKLSSAHLKKKKKEKAKVFDSTGVMKIIELLEIEKSCNITFYTALSESCSQTLV